MTNLRIIDRRAYLKEITIATMGLSLLPMISLAEPEKPRKAKALTQVRRTQEEIEAALKEIQPLQMLPNSDRWLNLPITYKALTGNNESLKIVMLGDSIINDTFGSNWGYFVQNNYPNCKLSVAAVVGNGTGCWWYKEENRIAQLVNPLTPDLMIIGGISQRDDLDSIEVVIKQIQSNNKCDILLTTKVFGPVDPLTDLDYSFDIPVSNDSYRKRLWKLAHKLDCGFLDMTAYWGKYIRESTKPLEWYKRDVTHANVYGEQVIGQILVKHFSPVPNDINIKR